MAIDFSNEQPQQTVPNLCSMVQRWLIEGESIEKISQRLQLSQLTVSHIVKTAEKYYPLVVDADQPETGRLAKKMTRQLPENMVWPPNIGNLA